MIRLTVLEGRHAELSVASGDLPLTIGRAPGSGLCLDDPGVWGTHATIHLEAGDGFVVEGHPEAGVGVNGVATSRQRLRNGDVLTVGGARVRFMLSETVQRGFRTREWLTWLAVLGLCAGQVLLIHFVLP